LKMTGASVRREQARSEMRAAILGAARKLLKSEGSDGVSMRAIARELGYSPAGLYEYFPSKEDLTIALYCEGTEGLAGRLAAGLSKLPADATSVDRLKSLGRSYRSYSKDQPDLFLLAFGGKPIDRTPNPEEDGETAFSILLQTAADALASGELAPAPLLAHVVSAWALVHGFVMLELSGFLSVSRGVEGGTADELFEAALSMLANGYLKR
jgi:AcrR family transcriptional regulator